VLACWVVGAIFGCGCLVLVVLACCWLLDVGLVIGLEAKEKREKGDGASARSSFPLMKIDLCVKLTSYDIVSLCSSI